MGVKVRLSDRTAELASADGFIAFVMGVPCFYPSLLACLLCRRETYSQEPT
jgi:hypothetical protein